MAVKYKNTHISIKIHTCAKMYAVSINRGKVIKKTKMKRGKSLTLGNLIVWLKKRISKLEKLNFNTATQTARN